MRCADCRQDPCICAYFRASRRAQRDEDQAEYDRTTQPRRKLPPLDQLFDRSVELGYIKPIAVYQAAA